MFRFIKKLERNLTREKTEEPPREYIVTKTLEKNLTAIKELFCGDSDFIVRTFQIYIHPQRQAALCFIDGLVNADTIQNSILRPLMIESQNVLLEAAPPDSLEDICNAFLLSGEIEITDSLAAAAGACLAGDSVLMVDGYSEFVFINTKGFEKRAITEPQTETVVRGSREGFTEVLRVNTALIRRRLKTSDLRLEMMKLGKRSDTNICLVYIDSIANPDLVQEVRKRLGTIDTDTIINSGYIEEYIEDAPFSLFHTIGFSEKPDIVAANILEGRCAVIIDGTPFVLTMPMLFIENFQSPEDYAIRPYIATFLRVIRAISFFISLIAPAIYVALTSFHQELIPTTLLFTIAASSEDVPFNSVVETIIMLVTFEILKEAGVRLPKPIGQAVSIVGALVMGQAAIEAGLVGAPVVIVIAFTAVASFLVPNVSDSLSILRWYLLILSSVMGGYGIILGLMTIMIHLASLESFGAAYLYPYSPFNATDMKDSILRLPLWKMRTRPRVLQPLDATRSATKKPEFKQDESNL